MDGGVTKGHFGLSEVGFAYGHISRGPLISGYSVVEVELAGCVLFIEGADAVEVAFGF